VHFKILPLNRSPAPLTLDGVAFSFQSACVGPVEYLSPDRVHGVRLVHYLDLIFGQVPPRFVPKYPDGQAIQSDLDVDLFTHLVFLVVENSEGPMYFGIQSFFPGTFFCKLLVIFFDQTRQTIIPYPSVKFSFLVVL
jgi:hypothetical protein